MNFGAKFSCKETNDVLNDVTENRRKRENSNNDAMKNFLHDRFTAFLLIVNCTNN